VSGDIAFRESGERRRFFSVFAGSQSCGAFLNADAVSKSGKIGSRRRCDPFAKDSRDDRFRRTLRRAETRDVFLHAPDVP
jgi:hypothetical protein